MVHIFGVTLRPLQKPVGFVTDSDVKAVMDMRVFNEDAVFVFMEARCSPPDPNMRVEGQIPFGIGVKAPIQTDPPAQSPFDIIRSTTTEVVDAYARRDRTSEGPDFPLTEPTLNPAKVSQVYHYP